MSKKPLESIEAHFSKVSDPREDRTKEHKLIDSIAIAICAVIRGAQGCVDIELYGKSNNIGSIRFLNCLMAFLRTILLGGSFR